MMIALAVLAYLVVGVLSVVIYAGSGTFFYDSPEETRRGTLVLAAIWPLFLPIWLAVTIWDGCAGLWDAWVTDLFGTDQKDSAQGESNGQ